MKLLLERGGNYKLRDAKGWNALYWASSKGSLNCVQFLLEHSLEYGDFLIEMVRYTDILLPCLEAYSQLHTDFQIHDYH